MLDGGAKSLTFGSAPISRRLLPKIQNYSALRGHYVMTSLLFCWGNNAPSGNYPKAPPPTAINLSSLPVRSPPLHFPPRDRERKVIQFFPLVCFSIQFRRKKNEEILHELSSPSSSSSTNDPPRSSMASVLISEAAAPERPDLFLNCNTKREKE